MRRLSLILFFLFACTSVHAQQAGRPRQVPTKPGTPCNARDFVAANDTGLWWGCNPLTRLWDPVTESGTPIVGTGTANQVSKFTAAQTLGNSGIADDGTTDTFKLTETAPTSASVALAGAGAGNVTNGAHIIKVTCVTAGGQTTVGTASSTVTVTDNTANGKVAISAIPLCSSIATGRDVYMNTVAAPTVFKLLSNGTIADNSTTTLTANDSDATLAASTTAPSTNTAIDARVTIGQSGAAIGAGSAITSSGAGGALGTGAFANTGTSGATIPLLNGANTVSGVETHSKAVIVSNAALTDNGSTIATDASLSNNFRVGALTANVTLSNPTNSVDGQVVTWEVIQNASAAKTLAFGTNFAFGAEITGCTISATLSSHNFITAIYNSTMTKWLVRGCLTGY